MSFFRLSVVVGAFAAVFLPLSGMACAQSLSGASIAVETGWPSGYMGLGEGLAWVVATRGAEMPVAEEPVADTPITETPVMETSSVEKSVAEEPVADGPVAEKPLIERVAVAKPVASAPPVRRDRAAKSRVARRAVDNWTPTALVAESLDHTGMNIASLGLHVRWR